MISEVVEVGYGRPAAMALAAAVRAAKSGRALAPVTVVVPTNLAGLSARRLLGSGALGLDGIANVQFLTPFRLAELLAADQLLDTLPLTKPVLGAAVRRALAEEPGAFAPVARHHATEAAVASLYAELSNVSDAALQRVASHGCVASGTVAVHRAVAARLGGFHDEAAVAAAAAARPLLAQALEPFGAFVWYLPAPVHGPLAHLLSIVFALAPTHVVRALTGDPEADAAVLRACRLVGVGHAGAAGSALRPAVAARIISASDADEEVRAVVRDVVALAQAGTPLDRIAVFYPTSTPYLGLLEQHLAAAGLPASGPSRLRLSGSVAGRTLLAALDLPDVRWRRDRVLALVSAAPLRHDGRLVHATDWERISREAGVVQGLEDWHRKLAGHRALLQQALELPALGGRSRSRHEHDVAEVVALTAFVDGLAAAVGAVRQARTWGAKARAARDLLVGLLGPDGRHQSWPEAEQGAFARVEDALTRLATLDELEPHPDHDAFLAALAAELDTPVGRTGSFGLGVVYGPLQSAVGHDADAVFVVGCAEGLLPAPRRDDALLSDVARQAAHDELERRESRLHDQHRWLLAALAAAPPEGRTLLFPRGDLRSARRAIPSRWLLDSAGASCGSPVTATRFDELDAPYVDVVPSHATAVLRAAVHASVAERDAAALAPFVEAGGCPSVHPLAQLVGSGFAAQVARRSSEFTEWDGNLAGEVIPATDAQPISPSRLETWAACGFRYFLQHLLGLAERDDPDARVEVSPLDRGSGVHAALDRFMTEVLDSGAPVPEQPWSPERRERLAEIAGEVFDDVEARGRTGRPLRWRLTRTELLATLDAFLVADDEHRRSAGATPSSTEVPFGMHGVEPVRLELTDGRVLSFRGKADRVDVLADGRARVFDYKTGRAAKYDKLDADPVLGGLTLQLGLYAEAALQLTGASAASAHYWLIDAVAQPQRGYEWTAERRHRFIEVVAAIVEGIEGGLFPAVPGDWNLFFSAHDTCRHCDFDRICPRDRGEMAEVKLHGPVLRARSVLAGRPT